MKEETKRSSSILSVGGLVSLLFAGNVYFVNRLVIQLDNVESIVYSLRSEVAILHAMMDMRKANGEKLPKRDIGESF